MEPAAAAVVYGLESVVEGAAAVVLAIKQPTMPLRGRWHKIACQKVLPRSSHSISLVKGKIYMFGGEERPQQPVDNTLHVITLPASAEDQVDYQSIGDDPSKAPPPRLGHTAATIGDRIYIFGGLGGAELRPLDEKGRVWVFDTTIRKWSYIDPMPNTPYPEPRAYHASTSTVHPLPSPSTQSSDGSAMPGYGSIFIHGGCPESGRLSDVWCFDVAAATWSSFPAAPEPARSGSALALSHNRIYRYGGFDGGRELGGQIDYLRIAKSTFDDKGGKGEMAVFAETDRWESVVAAPGEQSPGARSVAALHPITTGQGRNFILSFLGEKSSSAKGHEGIGEFWDDVWSFQTQPTGMSGASFKDAAREAVGAKTAESTWTSVDIPEFSKDAGHADHPGPRGWFSSAHDEDFDGLSVVLWGGISPSGERMGDGWILTIEA